MLILLLAGCVVFEMVTLGTTFTRSSKLYTLARSNVSLVSATTEAGTSWMDSVRLLAVTTTSARPAGPRGSLSEVSPDAAWPDRHPASESMTTAHSSDLQPMLFPLHFRGFAKTMAPPPCAVGQGLHCARLLPVSVRVKLLI